MKKKIVISAKDLCKTFKIPHERHQTIKQAALNLFSEKTYTKLEVLKSINFEVYEGEFFGIIGRNGSGKSTLLKILAGIYTYDSGELKIDGQISPFLELGVGFNPELTGRENIYLNGAILGLSRKEITEKFDEIVEFSELKEFMDQKLKNYSSGMQVRLAFSVAIHAHAPIILLDEVLAVGDMKFQKKCYRAFDNLKKEGRTIIFVTHSMDYVKDFCNKVIVLDKGRIAFSGNPEKAAELYYEINNIVEDKKSIPGKRRYGNKKALIENYKFLSRKKESIFPSEKIGVELLIKSKANINKLAVGIYFREDPYSNLFGVNSYYHQSSIGGLKNGKRYKITVRFKNPLNPGKYYVSFSLADVFNVDTYTDLDFLNNETIIKVVPSAQRKYWGLINVEPEFNIEELSNA